MLSSTGEIRGAVRRLSRAPGSSLTVALTLALGLGATTALFSLVDALLLRPLAVREPDRLVAFCTVSAEGCEPLLAYADIEEYGRARDVFAGVAAHRREGLNVRVDGATERVWGEEVSPGYFDVLRPRMARGRGLDAGASAAGEVVVSHEFWRRRMRERDAVLDESIEVGGRPHTIVGVADPRFRGTGAELGMGTRTELWVPPQGEVVQQRRGAFEVTARLAPGVNRETVEAAATTIAARLAREYPKANSGDRAVLSAAGRPRVSPERASTMRSFLGVLGAGVLFLLLAACVNVAHLQLARGLERGGEMAVRAALGAGRGRLVRQLVTEQALLAVFGFVASLTVALATQQLFLRFSLPFETPIDYDLRLDWRVLLFAGGLTAIVTVGFGVFPALRAARPDLRVALHGPVATPGGRRARAGQVLVALQAAASLTLMVGAGLFVRSLERAARLDLGFRVEDVSTMRVDFRGQARPIDEARARRFYEDALARVRALPGVRSAAWAGDVPLGVRQIIIAFYPEPRETVADAEWVWPFFCDVVSDGYFKTMGIRVRGREFTRDDGPAATEVAVVNEAAARKYWPGLDPVGRRFKVRGRTGVRTIEVVGVARDVRQRSLRDAAAPRLYFALAQRHFAEMALHVHAGGEIAPLLARIRAELAVIEPDVPVFAVGTMKDQVNAALSQPRMAAALLGAFAVLALALAGLGLYGVSARAAGERRREIGIRIALGAFPGDVLRLILRQTAGAMAIGLAVGLAAAAALGRGVQVFLLDVAAADALTYAASIALLAAVAAAAVAVPVRRLTHLPPATVLRQE